MILVKILLREPTPFLHNIIAGVKISRVNALDITAGKPGVQMIDSVVILPAQIARHIFHMRNLLELFNHFVRHKRHALRNAVVLHLVFPLSLMQRNLDGILTGSDQVLLNLLICSLNCRYNRNNSCNTDNNSQHRQEGTHLVSPDSAER